MKVEHSIVIVYENLSVDTRIEHIRTIHSLHDLIFFWFTPNTNCQVLWLQITLVRKSAINMDV